MDPVTDDTNPHPSDAPLDEPHPAGARGLSRRRALQLGLAAAGVEAAETALAGRAAATTTTPTASAALRAGRSEKSFDSTWRFQRGDAAGAAATAFDDTAWRVLDLPHDWSIEDLPYATSTDGGATADPSTMAFQTTPPPSGTPSVIGPFDQSSPGGKSTGYTIGGIGWYRKHFVAPAGSLGEGSRTSVRFDGIFHNATIWVNGTQLTQHVYGYTPVTVDLTSHLVTGDNVIAVKVDNTAADSRWYSGSGIYRHTWLTVASAVSVPDHGISVTTPVATSRRAVARVRVDVLNRSAATQQVRARVTVLDPRGHRLGSVTTSAGPVSAGQTRTLQVDAPVTTPSLWNPASPALYSVQTDVLVGATVVDTVVTPFGIRALDWDAANGLLINGQKVIVKGACLHANYGPLGAQALGRSVERQVEILKAAGFNSIRTAHNPSDPYLLDVCDRLGMLVWDEAFDHWSGGSFTPDFVADLTTFIRRDRNHPSVIVWSTGNEVNDPVLGKQLHDIVHALDPTRPATQGATPFDSAADPQYAYVDVSDVHYRFTDKQAIRDKYPDRPMTQSESWPATIYEDYQFALETPWFVGSWVWIGWDYLGESGAGATITASSPDNLPVFGNGPFPWFNDYQGDIDLIGQRKPQNHWRAVVYGDSPVELFVERPAPAGTQQYANNWSYYDELQSWTWDVPVGQAMVVHVYTSGDSVSLQLNGATIATQDVVAADRCVATFTVPYTPGTLTAVVSAAGTTIGRASLETVGAPWALRLTSDLPALTTSRDALAHVLVEVLDRRSRRVPDATTQVSFDVTGAGRLVGVGNGNPHNIDSFQRPHRYTWHGQALAIVRPTAKPGLVSLVASAPGLRADRVDLQVTA